MMVIIYENINEKMAKEIMANGELIGGRYLTHIYFRRGSSILNGFISVSQF